PTGEIKVGPHLDQHNRCPKQGLRQRLLVIGKVTSAARTRLEHTIHVQHRAVLRDEAQTRLIAWISPGMWYTRWTDHSLAGVAMAFVADDTRPQGAGECFVPFFLLGVNVLGHREPWREGHFNP